MVAVVQQYTTAAKKENAFYEKNYTTVMNLLSKFNCIAARFSLQ